MTIYVNEVASSEEYFYSEDNEFVSIYVDGEKKLDISDNGCPEDMILCRDLSDVFNVTTLMELMYNLGKSGEEVIFTHHSVDTWNFSVDKDKVVVNDN